MRRLWAGLKANLRAGTRLALFLPVRFTQFRISAGHYAMLVAASFLAWLVGGMLRGGFPGSIDGDALLGGLAQLPLVLLACLIAAALLRDTRLALALAVVITATDPLFEAAAVVIAQSARLPGPHVGLLSAAFIAWGIATLVRALHVASGWKGARSAGAAAVLIGLLGVFVWFFPRDELWSTADEPVASAPTSLLHEDVFHLQGELLGGQLADLQDERPDVADLYFLGVASDASQPAAAGEVQAVRRLMDRRFDTSGRSLVLANNPASLTTLPIATATNLEEALSGLGDIINPDEDVVFVYLSARSARDQQLAFAMPPLTLGPVNPTRLARMLADSGIKWRVIVVAACYSGGFIEPLKDDNSLIITASDSDQSSPACEAGEEPSWFTSAFFDAPLRSSRALLDAFPRARAALQERARQAGERSPNPQIYLGSAMKEKLDRLQKRLQSNEPDRPSVRAAL